MNIGNIKQLRAELNQEFEKNKKWLIVHPDDRGIILPYNWALLMVIHKLDKLIEAEKPCESVKLKDDYEERSWY